MFMCVYIYIYIYIYIERERESTSERDGGGDDRAGAALREGVVQEVVDRRVHRHVL